MNNKKINIGIEGPVASGKGTVAWRLSQKLGYTYCDTGAMYRSIAYACNKAKIPPDNQALIESFLKTLQITYTKPSSSSSERCTIHINGQEVTPYIRTPQISDLSSILAGYKSVRDKVNEVQRKLTQNKGAVGEGQSMIEEIMPNAELKVYLTADEKVRAHRRWLDYKNKNIDITLEEVLHSLQERDQRDANKQFGQMKKHPDAIYIDTTHREIDEVVEILYQKALTLL